MNKNQTLYVFRHGETYFTKNNLPYGKDVYKAEILAEGIPVVKKLAIHLTDKKIELFYSSPFKRCVQTSKIVSGIVGLDFKKDYRLSEFIYEKDNLEDVRSRILNFLEEIEKLKSHTIAICTHGEIISGIIKLVTKGGYEESDMHAYPNPGILVEIKDKEAKYTDFN